jgi:hypothetical protein
MVSSVTGSYDSNGFLRRYYRTKRMALKTEDQLEQVAMTPMVFLGDITISIHNIESARHDVPSDSVDFAAKVA